MTNYFINFVDDVNDAFVQMMHSMCGGNPMVLMRDATSYVWPESSMTKSQRKTRHEETYLIWINKKCKIMYKYFDVLCYS